MFFSSSKSILGLDIGTSHIKVVQISRQRQPVLETYGIANASYQLTGNGDDEAVISRMAVILKALLEKSRVTAKSCVVSFPNGAVFSSVIELPQMSEAELASAVEFEAKKYVPLPLAEIDLSWSIISRVQGTPTMEVLLTAIPKQITAGYMKILELSGLEAEAGEIEVLALMRSLIGDASSNRIIVDIGARSTSINIIKNGLLRLSRNLNIGGDMVTSKLADTLQINFERAEQFKQELSYGRASALPTPLQAAVKLIKKEIEQLLVLYQSKDLQDAALLLTGGGAALPGLVETFGDFGLPVQLANPLRAVGYSREAAGVLQRCRLSLPVAIGLGLRNA